MKAHTNNNAKALPHKLKIQGTGTHVAVIIPGRAAELFSTLAEAIAFVRGYDIAMRQARAA
jgi:hypothetical protein